MIPFKNYSRFYDLFYEKKDYPTEVAYIQSVIKKFSPHKVKNILSLGCGTCNHDILLAKKGFQITGLDRSKTMLDQAQKKLKQSQLRDKITLYRADVRRFELNKEFDFAMAMFNVVGYQTTNDDINKMLACINRHLKGNSLFVFDCWYQPAVILDPPTDRVKEVKKNNHRFIRLTRSTLYHQENVIEINFQVLSLSKNRLLGESNESHRMRYWSLPEIRSLLANHNLKFINSFPFLSFNSNIPQSQWDMFIISQKQ